MLAEELSVKILHNFSQEYIPARIIPMVPKHIQEFESIWQPRLQKENYWDQNLNLKEYLNDNYECYVLESDSIAQGIVVLKTAKCLSRLELGENLVYLTLIDVAPWNRALIQGERNYKAVGTVLLTFAILRSLNLGFHGRVGLHAIKKAESFFQKLPFISTGYDLFCGENQASCIKLKYFEIPENEVELIMLNAYLTWYLN